MAQPSQPQWAVILIRRYERPSCCCDDSSDRGLESRPPSRSLGGLAALPHLGRRCARTLAVIEVRAFLDG